MRNVIEEIEQEIGANDIVLFMKGNKQQPMCGFSGVVVQILNKFGLKFRDIDVLKDEAIRQGIKDFTNWPTIPQLYIKGEFIGGCDIVRQMYQDGAFEAMLRDKGLIA